MARYTGPKARVSRRLGTNIWGHQGREHRHGEAPVRRPATTVVPVGAATSANTCCSCRRSRRRGSPTASVSVSFRTLYAEASRRQGVTGENLLQLLRAPSRQHRVPRRLGGDPPAGASVRDQHGHMSRSTVRKVNIPSYRVRKGDVVRLRDKSSERSMVVHQQHGHVLGSDAAGVARGDRWWPGGRHSRVATARTDRPAQSASNSSWSSTPSSRHPHGLPPFPTGVGALVTRIRFPERQTTPPEVAKSCWSFSVHPSRRSTMKEGNRQRFAITPLEPGFGHTIGNSLRRTLLSSIPGAAITQVRFDDALHEFDTIAGVYRRCHRCHLEPQGHRRGQPQRRAGDAAPRREAVPQTITAGDDPDHCRRRDPQSLIMPRCAP